MTVSLQISDLKMDFISELSKLRLLSGTRRGRRQDGGGVRAYKHDAGSDGDTFNKM